MAIDKNTRFYAYSRFINSDGRDFYQWVKDCKSQTMLDLRAEFSAPEGHLMDNLRADATKLYIFHMVCQHNLY